MERTFLKDNLRKIGFSKNLARDYDSDEIFTDGGAYSDFTEEQSEEEYVTGCPSSPISP
jgi:hypothetical protein